MSTGQDEEMRVRIFCPFAQSIFSHHYKQNSEGSLFNGDKSVYDSAHSERQNTPTPVGPHLTFHSNI
jgi:hypothetical protein